MEFKWFAIMMIGIAIAAALTSSVTNKSDPQVSIEAAKAGLEQCPVNDMPNPDTIWVKDCLAYMKARKEYRDD